MGSNCPSQNIQPAGAKLPANILISPTYGCAMVISLSLAWEDALKGYAEREGQKGLHVQMRLASPNIRDGTGQQASQRGWWAVDLVRSAGCQKCASRNRLIAI